MKTKVQNKMKNKKIKKFGFSIIAICGLVFSQVEVKADYAQCIKDASDTYALALQKCSDDYDSCQIDAVFLCTALTASSMNPEAYVLCLTVQSLICDHKFSTCNGQADAKYHADILKCKKEKEP